MKKTIFCGLLFLLLHLHCIFAQQEADFEWEESLGTVTITGYEGNDTAVTIPGNIQGLPVTVIAANAFANKGLTGVVIPDSVRYIEPYAFANNELAYAIIQNGVFSIGDGAFSNNKLTGITIPDSVSGLGQGAFARNRLTGVAISDSIGILDSAVFAYNSLSNVVIPGGVLIIDYAVFACNPVTSITIREGVSLRWEMLGGNDSFEQAYEKSGRLAGTYTRPNPESTVWTRED